MMGKIASIFIALSLVVIVHFNDGFVQKFDSMAYEVVSIKATGFLAGADVSDAIYINVCGSVEKSKYCGWSDTPIASIPMSRIRYIEVK